MTYVIDTHALVWFLQGSRRLGAKAAAAMRAGSADLIIPAIVLAEVKYLAARARVDTTLERVMGAIRSDSRVRVYPIDERVVELMPLELDIHDALVCGTALIYKNLLGEDVKVITRDEAIANANIVETVW